MKIEEAAVEAAARAGAELLGMGVWEDLRQDEHDEAMAYHRIVLTAAADALEGAIRAEALAPVAAVVANHDYAGGALYDIGLMLGDSAEAVAKHNAAILSAAMPVPYEETTVDDDVYVRDALVYLVDDLVEAGLIEVRAEGTADHE